MFLIFRIVGQLEIHYKDFLIRLFYPKNFREQYYILARVNDLQSAFDKSSKAKRFKIESK